MNNKSISILTFIAMISLTLFSCKKTETIGLPDLPQDRMLEYKVTNLPNTVIYGAIDHIENTVTVYLPYYHAVSHIDPEIELQLGATLTEEIQPVSVNEGKQTYTVNGKNGSSRTYRLVIAQQNPLGFTPFFNTSNPSAYPYSSINVWGDFYSTNASTLWAKITHKASGREFQYDDMSETKISVSPDGYRFPLEIPAEAEPGNYEVEISFLGNTAKMEQTLEVKKHQEPRTVVGVKTVSQGGILTQVAQRGRVFLGLTKMTVTLKDGIERELSIISADLLNIEARIPDDFPVGKESATFRYTYSGWPSVVAQRQTLTVNAKE